MRSFLAVFSVFSSTLLSLLPCAGAATPTLADVPYGDHPKQVLDFYKAPDATAEKPAPLLYYVHGGGWMTGNKIPEGVDQFLKAGISVVAVEYRWIQDATAQGVYPPVKACLYDCARALQFVRSKAGEWHIDPKRVAAYGGSAGGFTSLWLAFHPDLADPASSDPIARQSTRVVCALGFVPQTSLDPVQMRQWCPDLVYGNHAFSLPTMDDFVQQREKLKEWIADFSPYALATPDDAPVLLFYDKPPAMGQPTTDPVHSSNFGVGLAEKLKAVGIEYELHYPGAPGQNNPDLFAFVAKRLNVAWPPKP